MNYMIMVTTGVKCFSTPRWYRERLGARAPQSWSCFYYLPTGGIRLVLNCSESWFVYLQKVADAASKVPPSVG